ncbi:MAG TPA: chorismate synthase [Gemmatimonadaceae bacterium]|nr:chorismate synthase [Gemmatimonadaceae bacterium]
MRFTTAGESHGPSLVSILEGLPAGVPVVAAEIDRELSRRQMGHGRGRRMQIEKDAVEILSGVRGGQTIGSPIAMLIQNRDWKNWQEIMDPALRDGEAAAASGVAPARRRAVTRVRPGHADHPGMMKYDRADGRDILERASARETTARVAAGAICRGFLAQFGVRIGSHVIHLGGFDATVPASLPEDINAVADESAVRMLDRSREDEIIAHIDAVKREGNTLGGACEIVCTGHVVGLGSHVSWDRKLDGRLAQAIMSIPAVKAVEIGTGVEGSRKPGSEVHDEIDPAPGSPRSGNVRRRTNRAGGLEGGITNGEPLVIRAYMKPISTLMRPLGTVDLATGEPAQAVAERSDVTAVPAMGVIAEAMVAFIVADAIFEKFGGDSLGETLRNHDAYLAHIGSGRAPGGAAGGR